MLVEPISIDLFVKHAFDVPEIAQMIEDWVVDFEVLRGIIASSLRDLGIYQVKPNQASAVVAAIVQQLKWSGEVRRMILRAEAIERQRLRTRHNEL